VMSGRYRVGRTSLTVQLAQSAVFSEFMRRNAESVILDDACPACKVNGSLDSGCLSVERVVEQLEHYARERYNGRRRLDLGDHLWGQRQDGGGCECLCHGQSCVPLETPWSR
jgi:hypothetical protein